MSWLLALCSALLVDVPILAAAAGGWWATVGLLHLSPFASLVFAGVIAGPALWAVAMATRWAIETRLDGET